MRTLLALPPGRTVRALLLAAALCACGGADEGGKGGAEAAPRAAALASLPADSGCTPPPAVDPALFTGAWADLVDSLAAGGASFPRVEGNRDVARVPLCNGCTPVSVELSSDTTSYCTRPGDLQSGRPRVMALMVLREAYPAQGGWNNLAANDSIFVFASDTSGYATMVYRNGARAATAPDTTFAFYYCPDGHPGRRPQAQWRPRGQPPTGAGGRARVLEEGGGTYGWMACASGCCQFYTPPPNQEEFLIETPHKANPKAPDTVGPGFNRAETGWGRPYWCTGA